ncbi:MAG: hypothetical protein WAW61_22420 [Methylococcaceae bacterium]
MTIQRYNQGFGGFGTLEKCSDGKLVKYSDHEAELSKCEGEFDYFLQESVENENLLDTLLKELDATKNDLKKSDRYFIWQTINVFVLVIATTIFLLTK